MVAKAADTTFVLQVPIAIHSPQFGNPCPKSKLLVCNVNAFGQFIGSQCPRYDGLGAVKYAVSVNYRSRLLLFIKLC